MTYRSHLSWWYVGEIYRANALKTSENCDRNARTLLLQAGVEKANSVSILNLSKSSDQILHDSHHGTPVLNEHEWTTLLYAAIELEFSSTWPISIYRGILTALTNVCCCKRTLTISRLKEIDWMSGIQFVQQHLVKKVGGGCLFLKGQDYAWDHENQ